MASGTSENVGGKYEYFSVGYGKFRIKSLPDKSKVDASTPGATRRVNKDGKESYSIEKDWVSGFIESIVNKIDGDYGNEFVITLKDSEGDKAIVTLKENSRIWFNFFGKLPNVDLSKEVVLKAGDNWMSVKQDGKKIENFYIKEEAGKKISIGGYPSSDKVDWKDKDDIDLHNIAVKKFIKKEFSEKFSSIFSNKDFKEEVAEVSKTFQKPSAIPSTNGIDAGLPF